MYAGEHLRNTWKPEFETACKQPAAVKMPAQGICSGDDKPTPLVPGKNSFRETTNHINRQEVIMETRIKNCSSEALRIFLVLSVLFAMSCGAFSDSSAKTAQEFVQKYSKAYKDENVGAVMKMTELGKGQTEQSLKDEIINDFKSKGFGYKAWTNTRYVSEEDRDSYIRVKVEVKGAPSSIVLVKREGLLKMVLNPSDYM